tara:strand:- start:1881 stop:3092 length:1212 start_codon:yes stop_codon:yes gene_type:complete
MSKNNLLKNRNFINYLQIRWFNSIAIQAITLTVGWQVYEMTRNPIDLGLVALAQVIPIFVFILPSGIIADKFDRKKVLTISNIIHLIITLYLYYYALSDPDSIYPILIALMINGIARSIYQPSLQAILPNIVEKKLFPIATAYYSSVSKLGHLFGPLMAGIIIAFYDVNVYLFAAICFVITILSTLILKNPKNNENLKRISISTVLSGFAYVWKKKLILGTMTIDLFAVLFGGIMGMLPIFAIDILKIGPDGLGLLRAMPAIGGVFMGALLTQIPPINNAGRNLIISTSVFGFATAIFAISDILWLSLSMLFIYGAADMMSVYVRQTIIPIITPDEMRGRVAAVHSVTTNSSNEIGDFRAGITAGFIGIVPAVCIGGIATIGVSLLWSIIFPEIKKVKRLDNL